MAQATGNNQCYPFAIGSVVILCLLFSIVESKLILPAHLAGMKAQAPSDGPLRKLQNRFNEGLRYLTIHHYRPMLVRAIEAQNRSRGN